MNDPIDPETQAQLQALLGQMAQISPASDQQPFREVPGWDSLKLAEFIIALQKRFSLRLRPADIADLVNLEAAYELIARRRASGNKT